MCDIDCFDNSVEIDLNDEFNSSNIDNSDL